MNQQQRNLVIERFKERHLSFATTTAFSDYELLEYNQNYIHLDTLSDSLNLAECGVIIDTAQVLTDKQMQSLEIHERFYSRAGMMVISIITIILLTLPTSPF